MSALALAGQTTIELINDTKIAYRQFGTGEPLWFWSTGSEALGIPGILFFLMRWQLTTR